MRKTIHLEGVDAPIVLSRRKGARSIRISITSSGVVRLTVPHGIPEFTAKRFAQTKIDWINEHVKTPEVIQTGAHIGKSHSLVIEHADISRPSTKISGVDIRVRIPQEVELDSKLAQATIRKACEKALLMEAKTLLPQRIKHLSAQHDIPYASVTVKKLKSRWGACDNKNNISLNTYLLQLDWALIDYVICHELAHTVHHDHSPNFWAVVEQMLPNHKALRKELKSKPTDVITT